MPLVKKYMESAGGDARGGAVHRASIHARLATGDRYGHAEAEDDEDALVLAPQGQLGSRLPNATLTDPNPSLIDPKRPYPTPSAARLPRLANETPLQARENRLQNAPRVLGGQGDPRGLPPSQIAKIRASGAGGVPSEVIEAFIKQNSKAAKAVEAVVDNPSEGAFAQLMANLPGLLPTDPELAAVIADEMAKTYGESLTQRRGETEGAESLANMREYKREHDGKFAEVNHPRDFKPGDNPDSSETQAAEIGKGKKAIAKCLAEKVDVPNAVSRGDVGLISLRYGDEKSGLAHFKDRVDAVQHLSDTLVRGKAGKPYQQGQKLNIEHAGYVAALALTNSPEHSGYPKNWVLTSFGPKDKKAKGAD